MNGLLLVPALVALVAAPQSTPVPGPDRSELTVKDLAGAWTGTLTHEGDTVPVGFEFEAAPDGKVVVKVTLPVIHMAGATLGREALQVEGDRIRLGPLAFTHDAAAGTLSGTMPEGLVPVYPIPMVLHRADRPLPAAPRAEPGGAAARPAWTFEAGAPLWAGATFADGVVYAGAEDGRLHALVAASGRPLWSFAAGGRIRTRVAVSEGGVFFQADDGFLYRLDAASGAQRWRVKLVEKPIERLPFDDPRSRFDRFGSDVTIAGGRLFVGTHDGRVLALDPERGGTLWEFAAGESVLAAPAVEAGRVYFGAYDRHVYALDAGSGKLLWKRDTRGAVVSTPAVHGDRVVVGTRAYDLLGLDASTGEVAWKRYVWFSWVESSAAIRDGIAYVGSSDAASVQAVEAASGRPVWTADVYGWAWGQPAVTAERVYVGTASQKGYVAGHRGVVMALDRRTGRPLWHHVAPAADSGSFGFPGSPAVGQGLVFVTGLDGRVYAFPC
jgi:outer membrane protein assembly factor BamB